LKGMPEALGAVYPELMSNLVYVDPEVQAD
jgi:hypothetical protein